jgi:hypothetical protein
MADGVRIIVTAAAISFSDGGSYADNSNYTAEISIKGQPV